MQRYVAFLRAINVGGRRVSNDRLREVFAAIGFADVDTYLASGNVVFSGDGAASECASRIEAGLGDALGYEVPTFVRKLEDLTDILDAMTFAEALGHKRYVMFLRRPLSDEQSEALAELSNDVDHFSTTSSTINWDRNLDAGESMTTGEVETALGVQTTRRTLRTIERITRKFGND